MSHVLTSHSSFKKRSEPEIIDASTEAKKEHVSTTVERDAPPENANGDPEEDDVSEDGSVSAPDSVYEDELDRAELEPYNGGGHEDGESADQCLSCTALTDGT